MYQALYRKWRPKTFSEVVGQEHITGTLQRQVAEGHTAHAYLFTGTRGTGKTTCARILAKAINCLNPLDGAPCCQCEACLGIDAGNLLDITELDAASNNGVDQVRALREEAIYTPSVLKKRVYIIDEVHMLTLQAFNALLKIVEEPPEHLVFILATTELHKVPATILSRCQRFSFKRILPRDIEKQLMKIAEAESIELQPDGAEILARMANGALRDALSLLDQCRASAQKLDSRAILDALGLAGSIQSVQLMRCILSENTADTLMLFDQLYRSGKDTAALLGELSDLSREIAMLKAAPDGATALLTGVYDSKTLNDLGKDLPLRRFIFIATQLQSCIAILGSSKHPRTDAELCLLRLCDETLSGDTMALESRIARLETTVSKGISTAPRTVERAPTPPIRRYDDVPFREEPPIPSPPPPPEEPAGVQRVYDIPQPESAPISPVSPITPEVSAPASSFVWTQMMDYYKGRLRVDKRVFLNMAKGILNGDCLQVYCPSDLVQNSLNDPDVLKVLQEVTSHHVGLPIRIELKVGEPSGSNTSLGSKPKVSSPAPIQPKPTASQTTSEAAPPWDMTPPPEEDKLEEIIRAGSQLDTFKIK